MAVNCRLQIVYCAFLFFLQKRRPPALRKRKQLQQALKVMDVEKGKNCLQFSFQYLYWVVWVGVVVGVYVFSPLFCQRYVKSSVLGCDSMVGAIK